jgi:hypothetical protein
VGLDRILDRQPVQVELARDGVELLFGRLVETDPGEAASFATRAVYPLKRARGVATTFDVDGDVDDHGLLMVPERKARRRTRTPRPHLGCHR